MEQKDILKRLREKNNLTQDQLAGRVMVTTASPTNRRTRCLIFWSAKCRIRTIPRTRTAGLSLTASFPS